MAISQLALLGPVAFMRNKRDVWHNLVRVASITLFHDRIQILILHLIVNVVYKKLDFFKPCARSRSFADLFWDFVGSTVTAQVVLAALFVRSPVIKPLDNWSLTRDLRKFKPLPFCAKLAITRVVVDLMFYLGHRLIHTKALYSTVHQRHHEHRNPRLDTNHHFTVLDLFVEAYIPVVAGIKCLQPCQIPTSGLEETLLFMYTAPALAHATHTCVALYRYVGWIEACSHSGKPLPCSSAHAPLALVYNSLLGQDWDSRNVQFHHVHHQRFARTGVVATR